MTRGTLRRSAGARERAAWKSGAILRATKEANLAARPSECNSTLTGCARLPHYYRAHDHAAGRIATRPDLAEHRQASA